MNGCSSGSVSRTERDQIESWWRMMAESGYDMRFAQFGDEEYYSFDPAFGAPCDCVKAKVMLKEEVDEWGNLVDDQPKQYLGTALGGFEAYVYASSAHEAGELLGREFLNGGYEPGQGDSFRCVVAGTAEDVTREAKPGFDNVVSR